MGKVIPGKVKGKDDGEEIENKTWKIERRQFSERKKTFVLNINYKKDLK